MRSESLKEYNNDWAFDIEADRKRIKAQLRKSAIPEEENHEFDEEIEEKEVKVDTHRSMLHEFMVANPRQ